jgi:DNA uptake protein ComE-like DNA-binding protein
MKRIALVCTVLVIALGTLSTVPAYAQLGRQQGLLEPNVATEQELMALPHMNAALVKGIMERRPFLSIKDLDAHLAGSLSAEQRKELYGKMFVHINLNIATSEEIMLIPGMGRRMVHEFEEYRPYKSLAQFRKEIGKYVNEAELMRLEQYVFVPLNLNTAADEDLQSIPGLGRRMLREFKEYRPYANIEQFRKEIGKYVNAKEVARLERYVTLQ